MLTNSLIFQLTKPMISQHLVQKQNSQTCISVQRVSVCNKINKFESEEPKPVQVQMRRIQYVCYNNNSKVAQQLEQRARSGETLEIPTFGQSIAFSKIEYEPTKCQRQSNHL